MFTQNHLYMHNLMIFLGDTWQPNITGGRTKDPQGKDILYVAFNPGENAEKYIIFVTCYRNKMKTLYNVRHFLFMSI